MKYSGSVLLRFCFSWHITFFKTWVSLHPTREALHLLRVLKKVTSPLGSFATNSKSLEEHETCEDQKETIVNNIPRNCFSSLLNTQICAAIATNDLGKLSWLSWVCSMTTLHRQAVYIRCIIITHFSPYRPLERTKMIQYFAYEKEESIFNLQPDWKTYKHDNGIHIRFPYNSQCICSDPDHWPNCNIIMHSLAVYCYLTHIFIWHAFKLISNQFSLILSLWSTLFFSGPIMTFSPSQAGRRIKKLSSLQKC